MSAGTSTLSARERLVFPLDVAHRETALELVDELHQEVGVFKVGKQLFVQAGPEIVRAIQDRGGEVFLDLKFHDIPKTTALASVEAARLGVKMFTLHASGGGEMMQAASEAVDAACRAEGLSRPILLAVTVLTSLSPEDLRSVGINCSIEEHVGRLARLACHSGMRDLKILHISEPHALSLHIVGLKCPGVVLAHLLKIPGTQWLGRCLLHLLHGRGEQGLRGNGNSVVSLWRTHGFQSTHIVEVDHLN